MISSHPVFTSSPTYHHFWFHYDRCYLCICIHSVDATCIILTYLWWKECCRIRDWFRISMSLKTFACISFPSLISRYFLNFSLLGLEENQKHRVVRKVKAIYYGQWWKIRDSSDGINQKRTVVLIMYALILHYENSLLQKMECIS